MDFVVAVIIVLASTYLISAVVMEWIGLRRLIDATIEAARRKPRSRPRWP